MFLSLPPVSSPSGLVNHFLNFLIKYIFIKMFNMSSQKGQLTSVCTWLFIALFRPTFQSISQKIHPYWTLQWWVWKLLHTSKCLSMLYHASYFCLLISSSYTIKKKSVDSLLCSVAIIGKPMLMQKRQKVQEQPLEAASKMNQAPQHPILKSPTDQDIDI